MRAGVESDLTRTLFVFANFLYIFIFMQMNHLFLSAFGIIAYLLTAPRNRRQRVNGRCSMLIITQAARMMALNWKWEKKQWVNNNKDLLSFAIPSTNEYNQLYVYPSIHPFPITTYLSLRTTIWTQPRPVTSTDNQEFPISLILTDCGKKLQHCGENSRRQSGSMQTPQKLRRQC